MATPGDTIGYTLLCDPTNTEDYGKPHEHLHEVWRVEAVGSAIQPYKLIEIPDASGSWHTILTLRTSTISLLKPVALGGTPAQSGALRLEYNQAITARNGANTGDVELLRLGSSGVDLGGISETVRMKTGVFTATSGAPFSVASSVLVSGLNADLLDGYHAADFAAAGHTHSHSSLTGVTADQHHAQVHGLDSADHTGTLSWTKVSKTGSNLLDLSTRNHNDLQSLQGGASGEYYHLTSAQLSGLTGGGNTSLHLHDDRYSLTSHTHSHSSLTGVTADQHHAQVHGFTGGDHSGVSVTSPSAGQVLRYSGTAWSNAQLSHADLGGITADQHHAQVHGLDSADHTGTLSWTKVSKTGSNLLDLATRNHSDLQSLQGGTADQYYHLTSAQHTGLTSGGNTSLHTHDKSCITRPYSGTKTAVGFSASGTAAIELTIGLSGTYDLAPGHDHPYAPTSHTHTKSQITDFTHDIAGSDHTGTLTIAKGGTGRTSFTSGYVLIGGSTQVGEVAPISTSTYTVDYVTPTGQHRRLTFTNGILTNDASMS